MNGQLTKNFNLREFQCPCCRKVPDVDDQEFVELYESLQSLRNNCKLPIYINSGFRCTIHNIEVGGVKTSQHLKGHAADIIAPPLTIPVLFEQVKTIQRFVDGGILVYETFIHVDVRKRRYFRNYSDYNLAMIRS